MNSNSFVFTPKDNRGVNSIVIGFPGSLTFTSKSLYPSLTCDSHFLPVQPTSCRSSFSVVIRCRSRTLSYDPFVTVVVTVGVPNKDTRPSEFEIND